MEGRRVMRGSRWTGIINEATKPYLRETISVSSLSKGRRARSSTRRVNILAFCLDIIILELTSIRCLRWECWGCRGILWGGSERSGEGQFHLFNKLFKNFFMNLIFKPQKGVSKMGAEAYQWWDLNQFFLASFLVHCLHSHSYHLQMRTPRGEWKKTRSRKVEGTQPLGKHWAD